MVFSTILQLGLIFVSVGEPIIVDSEKMPLGEHVYLLEDKEGRLEFDEVMNRLNDFKKSTQTIPNVGLTDSTYWFYVEIQPRVPLNRMVLELAYPLLDSVILYQGRDDGWTRRTEGGDLLKFEDRFIDYWALNFEVPLVRHTPQWLLLRVKTESSMQLPVTLFSERSLNEAVASKGLSFGLYYGVVGLMVILNLLIFFSTKNLVYLLYVGYITTYLFFQMCLNGTWFQFVLPNHPQLAGQSLLAFNFATWGFAISFSAKFTKVKEFSGSLNLASRVVVSLMVVAFFLTPLLAYRTLVTTVVIFALLCPILLMAVGLVSWRSGLKEALVFVVAWFIFMVGAFVYSLKTIGILPDTVWTEYALQIGSSLEVVLITLAIGQQLSALRNERDLLNRSMLEKASELTEESNKRAAAEKLASEELAQRETVERLARIDAETRITVFSNAIHHLNNPLNHLQGAQTSGNRSFDGLVDTVLSLLPENPDDDELVAVRAALNKDINGYREEARVATDALKRASSAVHVLRTITGLDGASFAEHTFEALKASVDSRFSKTESLSLDWKYDGTGVSVIGAVEAYSQAVWLVLDGLAQHDVERVVLELHAGSEGSGFHRLKIIGASEAACAQVDDALGELIQQLLAPYKCELGRRRNELNLSIRATAQILAGEEQTKVV